MPVSMLMVFSFGGGLLVGLLFCAFMYFKLSRQNYKLRSRIKLAEKEVDNLRAIPLKDTH